jgi:two-component system LytT family response regulator
VKPLNFTGIKSGTTRITFTPYKLLHRDYIYLPITKTQILMVNNRNDNDPKIALPDKNELAFFEIKKIIRCKSDNSYTEFLIVDDSGRKKIYLRKVVSKGIYHFEEYLMSTGFFYRIHNQHIINLNYLKKIIKTDGGHVLMDDNTNEMIPIARARKEEFLNHLKNKGVIL